MKRLLGVLARPKRTRREKLSRAVGPPDRWLLGVALVLSFFGILMVFDASVAIALRDFSDKYHFAKEQSQWLALGLVALFVCSRLAYATWSRLALPLLIATIGLLVAVFLPVIGVSALGARRWINLGITVLQPAEFAKLMLVIYLAAWLSVKEKGRLLAFLLLLGMIVGLVALEPDLGTASVLLITSVLMYFFSGAPMLHFGLLVPAAAASLGILALTSPYRLARLKTFLNPESDPLGASYQIRQVLLALGSGGWFGLGIGKSRQKFEYLPEANTDAIFAIVGEELGFVGAALVVFLFFFLIWRGFRIARRAPDSFGRLLALGISSWIATQVTVNLAAMVALVPLTGIPLPLISYGGSSLVVTLAGVGILLNISRPRKT